MSADDELNAYFGSLNNQAEEVIEEPIVAPEPIIEPEPEPVMEPVIAPEPEPFVEPEPAMAPEPIVAPEPVPEEEPEIEEDSEVEEEDEEDDFESAKPRKSGPKWLLVLLAILVGLAGGYFLGSYYPYSKLMAPVDEGTVVNVQKADVAKVAAPEPKVEEAPSEEAAPAEEPAAEPQNNETDAKVKAEAEAKAKADAAAKAKAEADAKAKAAADKAAAEAKAKAEAEKKQAATTNKYDAMDVRVRLGAYRIVGTDKVVKVKEGDDLVKISRRILGPDMECYLEVFNNIKATTPLKVGQEIKIPKLELKKKKKAATAN